MCEIASDEGSQESSAEKRLTTKVTFVNCVALKVNLDLLGKSAVGSTIADASCLPDSKWKAQILSSYESQWIAAKLQCNVEDMLHYEIEIIEPGGKIDILATGFRLDKQR